MRNDLVAANQPDDPFWFARRSMRMGIESAIAETNGQNPISFAKQAALGQTRIDDACHVCTIESLSGQF